MSDTTFLEHAYALDSAGLLWQPEVGDEVAERENPEQISILINSAGYTPKELREMFLWLPRLEQLVMQIEMRQAILCHAGLELTKKQMFYRAVLKAHCGQIEGMDRSLRGAIAKTLRELILVDTSTLH